MASSAGTTAKCGIVSRMRASSPRRCSALAGSLWLLTRMNSSARRLARLRDAPAQRMVLRAAAPRSARRAAAVLGAAEPRQIAEGEVDATLVERRADAGRVELHRLDAHARRLAAQHVHQRRQELAGRRCRSCARETALRASPGRSCRPRAARRRACAAPPRRAGEAARAFGVGAHAAAACARTAGRCQRQPQPRQRVAHRRLRQAEPLGRAAHVARGVHGVEDVQQVEVEVSHMHGVHDIQEAPSEWMNGARAPRVARACRQR